MLRQDHKWWLKATEPKKYLVYSLERHVRFVSQLDKDKHGSIIKSNGIQNVTVYETLGVRRIINAKGTATRLSGGIMRPEVSAAMVEASQHCVDMAELQAVASDEIAKATGAEAGYVASGAAACLMLGAAACMAGLSPGNMSRLPDARGMQNEIIMVRSQRNFYDHAIRAAGATIIEVGLPDRYAGAGVRDAEQWEIEDAITERTAAIFYVADAQSQPRLKLVTAIAKKHRVPVIVDAAAQLPPQSNLKRFIAEGADLVAYSGGKAIGGPQASGILCGRKDLIMSAALQHLDLDIYDDMWEPPKSLIDRKKLKGMPQHGIGRGCKVGKEEIVGLLTALKIFIAEGDKVRHTKWLAILEDIERQTRKIGAQIKVENTSDIGTIPLLTLFIDKKYDATKLALKLQRRATPVYLDASRRDNNILMLNPVCIRPEDVSVVVSALNDVLG
jgi:D-glucosaminate-6-phosphate ammonia-lyase